MFTTALFIGVMHVPYRIYVVDDIWPRLDYQLENGSVIDVVQLMLDEYSALCAASHTLQEVLKPLVRVICLRELRNAYLIGFVVSSDVSSCIKLQY